MPMTDNEYLEAMRRHDAACGAAIRAWATFEVTLVFYFQAAAQITDRLRAHMIWASLPNLQARRKLLTRLAENYVSDDYEIRRFRIFMKRMSKLSSKRNLLICS
jgi:hypothetical protein